MADSYVERELKLVNCPEHLKDVIYTMFAVEEKMGLSGGAMSVVSDWYRHLEEDPERQLSDDSMLLGIQKAIEGLSLEDKKYVVGIFRKLSAYEPLTPLEGHPDEWIEIDHEGTCQNIRCGTVFKSDGRIYDLDGLTEYAPAHDYGWWNGRTVAMDISFPYNPMTDRKYVWYMDELRQHPFPPGIDPKAWLVWQEEIYRKGFDPNTMPKILPHWFNSSDESDIERIKNALGGDETEFRDDEYNYTGSTSLFAQIPSEALWDGVNFVGKDGIKYEFRKAKLMSPNRRFTAMNEWTEVTKYVIRPVTDKETIIYLHGCTFLGEEGGKANLDVEDYLYSKRVELGYRHPSRKKRKSNHDTSGTIREHSVGNHSQ